MTYWQKVWHTFLYELYWPEYTILLIEGIVVGVLTFYYLIGVFP